MHTLLNMCVDFFHYCIFNSLLVIRDISPGEGANCTKSENEMKREKISYSSLLNGVIKMLYAQFRRVGVERLQVWPMFEQRLDIKPSDS